MINPNNRLALPDNFLRLRNSQTLQALSMQCYMYNVTDSEVCILEYLLSARLKRKAENPSSRKFDNNFFVIFIENEWTKKT